MATHNLRAIQFTPNVKYQLLSVESLSRQQSEPFIKEFGGGVKDMKTRLSGDWSPNRKLTSMTQFLPKGSHFVLFNHAASSVSTYILSFTFIQLKQQNQQFLGKTEISTYPYMNRYIYYKHVSITYSHAYTHSCTHIHTPTCLHANVHTRCWSCATTVKATTQYLLSLIYFT